MDRSLQCNENVINSRLLKNIDIQCKENLNKLHLEIKKTHNTTHQVLEKRKLVALTLFDGLFAARQSLFALPLVGHRFAAVTRCVPSGPRTSIVRGNYIRETSVKRRNKIVQEITRNVANVFSLYAIIAVEHGFLMH